MLILQNKKTEFIDMQTKQITTASLSHQIQPKISDWEILQAEKKKKTQLNKYYWQF